MTVRGQNMQIIISVVCDTSKGMLYKQIKPHLVGEHAFPLMGFVCQTAHITIHTYGQPETNMLPNFLLGVWH